MQELVTRAVLKILKKAGFTVTDLVETKPRCFDIVARKDDFVILIKVLYNVDSLKSEAVKEMKLIAKFLKASPIVVGEKFKQDYLERGVVYTRYGIPVINVATLYDIIVENVYPLIYSAPGGYYVKIDSEKFKRRREELGLSIGEIASRIGITRRAAKKYEEGIDVSLDNAIKLEELLGGDIVKEINVFEFEIDVEEPEEEFEGEEAEIVDQLKCIGIKIYPVKYAPFDALSVVEDENVLTGVKQVREIERRASLIGRVSEVVSANAAYIVEKRIKSEVEGVVFITKDEISCVSSPKDFISLIHEKKEY
ncbi:transcriptional regulator, XRE family [Ferroglobus placidus DSM 10642]|uniref:Putative HTH-type transcriptional regulatory protein Ferp_2144 n=1 Tax=Ferroglobus placidus (strain DSM 10642 / AEDII12DO) TaxID=589924 RepID=D3S0N4_FERPA|nr:transcriptional regulator [Ferroglobus placidus]ADC66275.1 transcriptional regulator, XRE family [Ferroglobus placidus DSM 10642]